MHAEDGPAGVDAAATTGADQVGSEFFFFFFLLSFVFLVVVRSALLFLPLWLVLPIHPCTMLPLVL